MPDAPIVHDCCCPRDGRGGKGEGWGGGGGSREDEDSDEAPSHQRCVCTSACACVQGCARARARVRVHVHIRMMCAHTREQRTRTQRPPISGACDCSSDFSSFFPACAAPTARHIHCRCHNDDHNSRYRRCVNGVPRCSSEGHHFGWPSGQLSRPDPAVMPASHGNCGSCHLPRAS